MKQKFSVTGMMCAACQANVERSVRKLNGVKLANVSLLSNSMVVEYDEKQIGEEAIIQAVDKAGYGASIFVNESIKKIQEKKQAELKLRRKKLLWSLVFLIFLMIVSMGGMALHHYGNFPSMDSPYLGLIFTIEALLQVAFLVPIVVIHFSYFTSGFKSLLKGHPNMNSLIALGSSISMLYSLYGIIRLLIVLFSYGFSTNGNVEAMNDANNLYLESAGMILVFVSIGKYFEKKATSKTTEAISKMVSLTPDTAYLEVDGVEKEVTTDSLKEGDVVIVKSGAYLPADGIIVEGYGHLDESSLTGEANPIYKSVGDKVIAASINQNGSFKLKVTSVGKDTTISQIVSLVEQASQSKSPMANLADKISLVFVPTVIGLSLLTFIIWMILGYGQIVSLDNPFSTALNYAITVLVISCPCALGLATPVAIMVGDGKGAENGILIKSAQAFESLNQAEVVLFDKTGTLTKGEAKLLQFKTKGISEEEALVLSASLEVHSEHPLSKAIVEEAKARKLSFKPTSEFTSIPGKGIQGNHLLIGNLALMKENQIKVDSLEAEVNEMSLDGLTVLYLAKDGEVVALFGVGDFLKEEAKDSVNALKQLGKQVYIVSGDHQVTAEAIGKQLGVDGVFGGVLPTGKAEIIERFQKQGKKVAFVGDGVNDALALTKADIGIAIGAGSDIALDSADIVLVKSDPMDVVTAFNLSKKVVWNIKENLLWAFFYNILLIPLAAGVLSSYIQMKPMYGSIAMSLSSVTVVLNALRLRLFKAKKEE